MRVFGLTGGIAAGKSTVASQLRQRGWPVIDADLVARAVVEPGQPGLLEIQEKFGPAYIQPDGTLNRSAMRMRIANDPQAQAELNAILHPKIRQHIQNQLAELKATGHKVAFVEAALMIEAGSYRQYDGVLLVTAPYWQRVRRVQQRDGMAIADVRALIKRQMPDWQKRKYATCEVRNGGSQSQLVEQVELALQQLGIHPPD